MKLTAFLNSVVNNRLNRLGTFEAGYANGYVAIPKEHPYYGKDYDEIEIDIHGGLTFAGNGSKIEEAWPNIEIIEGNTKNLKDSWVFGFDTCHYGDNLTNWNRDAVIAETLNLRRQLEEAYE